MRIFRMRIWLIEAKDSFVPRLFCFYQPTSKCDPDASRSNRYISCFLNFSLPGGSNRVIPVYVRRIGKYDVKRIKLLQNFDARSDWIPPLIEIFTNRRTTCVCPFWNILATYHLSMWLINYFCLWSTERNESKEGIENDDPRFGMAVTGIFSKKR